MDRNRKYAADLILLIAAMIWGMGYYLQKVASETTSALTFNFLRYTAAALFLLITARFRLPPKGGARKYAILTGAAMFLGGNLQQIGVQLSSIGNASFITAVYIVLVPFLAALILRRKIAPPLYAAALLALAGLYLVTTGGNGLERISKGDLIVFAGSLMWAAQILLIDKGVRFCDPAVFTAGEFLTAAILQLLVWLTAGHCDLTGISHSWPYAMVSGIVVLGIASIMQSYGQKNTGETEASIIMGLESVFGTLAGFFLYHEKFSLPQIAGMGLIFAAVIIAVIKSPSGQS